MATTPPRGPSSGNGTGQRISTRPTVGPGTKAPAPGVKPAAKIPEKPEAKPAAKQALPRGLTPKQLLQMGRRFWGRNSQWVKLARAKKVGDAKTQSALAVIAYSTHDNYGIKKKPRDITRYLVNVHSLDNPGVPLSKSRRIKVSCQCKSHKFGCEYKLAKLGAADIVYSNGRPPETYFPNTPAVCKHVYKTVLEILRRGL